MSDHTFFSDLPEEMKVHIFSYLPLTDILSKVSRVSKEFRDLGLRSVEVLDLDIVHYLKVVTAENLQHLITLLSPRLKKLKLGLSYHQHSIQDVPLAIYALKCCANLNALPRVYCNSMTWPVLFQTLEDHGKALRIVSLTGLNIHSSQHKLLSSLKNLTEISLNNCSELGDDVLIEIGRHCKLLERFRYQGRWPPDSQISDVGINSLLESVCKTIKELRFASSNLTDGSYVNLGKCQQLEQLQFFRASKLKIDGLCSIVQLRKLTFLDISSSDSFNEFLSDEDFRRAFVGRTLECLKTLSLYGMRGLGDDGITAIAQSCPGLHVLYLHPEEKCLVTDVGIRVVLENCGQLRRLTLDGCAKVTREVFDDVRELLPHLGYLKCSGPGYTFIHYGCKSGVFE